MCVTLLSAGALVGSPSASASPVGFASAVGWTKAPFPSPTTTSSATSRAISRATGVPPGQPAADPAEDPAVEYERRRALVENDAEGLWELYEWCQEQELTREGKSCLRQILKLSPTHKRANEALGHIYYDGQWFKTQKKLDDYKREEEKRKAEEEGLVRWKDEWVRAEDLPFLEKGLVRDQDGEWVDLETIRRIAEGWTKQDLNWISPEEKVKVDQGLWKVGDQWLSLEDANKAHSVIGEWWVIPTDHFLIKSTCDRKVILDAANEMERAYKDIARVYGSSPAEQVPVYLLRSADQYGKFAAGERGVRSVTETHGLSSVHYAYFGDVILEAGENGTEWIQAGVGYWDADVEHGDRWGRFSARNAAAQSLAEALDPSEKANAKFIKEGRKGLDEKDFRAYYAEKLIPEWFRIGAVSYAERYFVDATVDRGGNPYWVREGSIQNILNKGGLDTVDTILKSTVTVDDPEGAAKLLNERGLLLAFILDGKHPELLKAHGALKAALRPTDVGGEGKKGEKGQREQAVKKAVEALETALRAAESDLRKFANV